jgi:hypothetical protein
VLAILGLIGIFAVCALPVLVFMVERRARRVVLPPEPAPGEALATEATRAGFARYCLHSVGIIVLGFAVVCAFGALGLTALSAMGLIIMSFGIVALLNSLRVWWFLRTHRWEAWDCRFAVVRATGYGNGSPTLVIEKDGRECVLGLISFVWRWEAFRECDGKQVWMAGRPEKGGVVAPPGGFHLSWARRPRTSSWRERIRRRVVERPEPADTETRDRLPRAWRRRAAPPRARPRRGCRR